MLYRARYVEDAAIEAAREIAQEWVRSDGYYGMYGGGGTGLVHRSSGGGIWDTHYLIDHFGHVRARDLTQMVLPNEWFGAVGKVSWRTCRGNYAAVEFLCELKYSPHHVTAVVVHMEGVRHGIPRGIHAMGEFEASGVVEYESWRTDASPFAFGLEPRAPTGGRAQDTQVVSGGGEEEKRP